MMSRKVGIFGGSFNPVHIGHLALANYLVEMTDLDEIWLTLSPQNPLKATEYGATDAQRFEMLKIACAGSDVIKPCDVELTMPRPSYTINTLNRLREMYPDYGFRLIIGGDNWEIFDKWRSSAEIIERYGLIVYPRPNYCQGNIDSYRDIENVKFVDAPMLDISSTMIRDALSRGHQLNYFLPHGVYNYIKSEHLYEK